MNTIDIQNLICWMLGFGSATFLALIYIIVSNRTLHREGEKVIEKMVAKKQVDFWFKESIRLFLLAAEASTIGDWDNLGKISQQHALAVHRFDEAKSNLL